jgi:hypothetical protein
VIARIATEADRSSPRGRSIACNDKVELCCRQTACELDCDRPILTEALLDRGDLLAKNVVDILVVFGHTVKDLG